MRDWVITVPSVIASLIYNPSAQKSHKVSSRLLRRLSLLSHAKRTPPEVTVRHKHTKDVVPKETHPFQQRVDCHGRPYGNIISSSLTRPPGPKNKIAPASSKPHLQSEREKHSEEQREHFTSPPYTRRRLNRVEETEYQKTTRISN